MDAQASTNRGVPVPEESQSALATLYLITLSSTNRDIRPTSRWVRCAGQDEARSKARRWLRLHVNTMPEGLKPYEIWSVCSQGAFGEPLFNSAGSVVE